MLATILICAGADFGRPISPFCVSLATLELTRPSTSPVGSTPPQLIFNEQNKRCPISACRLRLSTGSATACRCPAANLYFHFHPDRLAAIPADPIRSNRISALPSISSLSATSQSWHLLSQPRRAYPAAPIRSSSFNSGPNDSTPIQPIRCTRIQSLPRDSTTLNFEHPIIAVFLGAIFAKPHGKTRILEQI